MSFSAFHFDDAARERIKAAAEFERRARLESLLLIPTRVGRFELNPLTARQYLELEYAENKIIQSRPFIDDFIHLLWIVRPESDKRKEKSFANFVASNLTSNDRVEITAWFSIQFNDMPQDGGSSHRNEFDSGVWIALLIDTIASEYSWSLDEILDTSLATSFQLFQRIMKRKDPKYSLRNGITQQAKANEMKKLKTDG